MFKERKNLPVKRKINFIIIVLSVVLVTFLGYNFYIDTDDLSLFKNNNKPEIAYVNLQEIYNVHPAKQQAESRIDDLAREMESDLNEIVEELDGQEQQELLESYQLELSQKEQQLIEEVLENINQVINKLAVKKELRLVLDKQQVVYGGYNLTNDVINYIKENINLDDDFEIKVDLLQE